MTLSNAPKIVFLAATVPVLLIRSVMHGLTDSDDGNRGKVTFGCISPKNIRK